MSVSMASVGSFTVIGSKARLRGGASRLYTKASTKTTRRDPIRQVVTAAQKKTYGSFDEMISESPEPILVDFYATWCGPCHMLTPILSELSTSMSDKLKVVKINTETYPNIATKYKIEALPTMVLFKNGKPVDRIEGLPQQEQLRQRLEYFLSN